MVGWFEKKHKSPQKPEKSVAVKRKYINKDVKEFSQMKLLNFKIYPTEIIYYPIYCFKY